MRRTSRWALAGATLAAGLTGVVSAPAVFAHGTMSDPGSRIWECYYGDRSAPLCAEAWESNSQALYDWNEINQGAVAGAHRSLIPDGQLCSAGREKYAAFDVPSTQWATTNLTPDADGLYTLTWTSSAPHATEYFRVYLTNADFDPTQPLAWDDLALVHDSGALPREATTTMRMALPERDGHHILYTIWQRSDSPEAFYACSDVTIDADGAAPAPLPESTPEPVPSPEPEPMPEPMPEHGEGHDHSGGITDGVMAMTRITSDWGSGYCADVAISTESTSDKHWRVTLPENIQISSLWNGSSTVQPDGSVSVEGAAWNHMVRAGSPTSFGYCASRTAPAPTPTPAPAPTPQPTPAPAPAPAGLEAELIVDSGWATGACYTVAVRNDSSDAVADWALEMRLPSGTELTSSWSGTVTREADRITVTAPAWGGTIPAGGTVTHFGFCTSGTGLPVVSAVG